MIDVSNRVLSNVKFYISDVCQNVKNDTSLTPTTFPATYVVQIDAPDIAIDLENAENAVKSMVEIQTYSNQNISEAKKVINKACDAMRMMGYVRTYGPKKIGNAEDTNIFRMVARFSRIAYSVDEIKKFE
jgi:hypothetical protein